MHSVTISNKAMPRKTSSPGIRGYPVVGTPEQIAEEFAKMHEIGIEGIIFGGLDLLEEVKHVGSNVISE
jgi:alkanesulfonate monooxygenase SsuD/methylene tetrahydromethanopterin reductase-like flavin-dependent oxidoreductase (luciferase family)